MAQIAIEMTSEEARLWQGFQRIVHQQQKVEAGLGRTSRKSRESAKQATLAQQAYDKAFGRAAISSLANFAAGVVGIGTALTTVISLFQSMRQEADLAGQQFRDATIGVGSLAQLAETPAEMQKLVQAARQTFAEGGGNTLDEAAKLVFSLESAGALDERELFTQLKAKNLVEEPAVMARAAATLLTSLGEEETGGYRNLVSKSFGASKFSPSSAEEILQSAARSGGSAKALGYSDEELLAAVAVESKATGSAEVAGTTVASLLRSIDQSGQFQGMTLRETLKAIQDMGLEGQELQQFFGREEAVRAFRDLTANMDLVNEAVREITLAEAEDRVSQKLSLPESIPSINAAQEAKQAEARRMLSGEKVSTLENLADALVAQRAAETRTDGSLFPELENVVNDWLAWSHRFFGNESFLRDNVNEIQDEELKAQIQAALYQKNVDRGRFSLKETLNYGLGGTSRTTMVKDYLGLAFAQFGDNQGASNGDTASISAIRESARKAQAMLEESERKGQFQDPDFFQQPSLQHIGISRESLDARNRLAQITGDQSQLPVFSEKLVDEMRRMNGNLEQANAKSAIAGSPTLSPPSRDR